MPYPAPCPYPPGVTVQPLPPAEIGFTKDVQEPTPLEDSALPPVCVEVDGVAMQLSAFEDKIVRRAFIRKVFCVLALQLLVTFSVVCVFTFSKRVKKAVQENLWAYLSSYILFVIVALVLQFSGSIRRRHPWNLLALGLVTLSLSYMVGAVASFHDTTAVLFAMGTTLVIVFGIIIFSIQTRVDFSYCNGLLLVLALDLLMFGLFSCFFYSTILQVLYGALGALLFSVFLAVDAQLVLGREKYALSPEEYVFAALLLYLDIIMIFLYLLILLGGGSSN
ncbi:LFG1 protein, partial [Amia calva]|nr:LFG1 protein [Amia calva]